MKTLCAHLPRCRSPVFREAGQKSSNESLAYDGTGATRKAFDRKKAELGLDKVEDAEYHKNLTLSIPCFGKA